MPKSYGIKETKDILAYGEALATHLLEKKEDGVITVKEALEAFHESRKEMHQACVGAWNVPFELGDLTEEESKELREYAMVVFGKFLELFGPNPSPQQRGLLGSAAGIKETMEVLQFLQNFGDCLIEAKKDGKITCQEALEAFKRTQNDFFSATWGSWVIPGELADLDEYEARTLSEKVTLVALRWIDIFK